MLQCDLNCDMGEGIGNDEKIMPYLTSANIACGYHAGNENTMRETILLAQKFSVNIGAHPSFLGKENFGRTEIKLFPQQIYELVSEQITLLQKIVAENNATLHHVKPHGALYNMAAKNKEIAKAIAAAVKTSNENLILFALSGSHLISEAKAIGLTTASEVFADRTYQDDGSLTPRLQPNALIENTDKAIQQVVMMVKDGKIKTVSGKVIPIVAETICIHGDGKHAVEFAKKIQQVLEHILINPSTGAG